MKKQSTTKFRDLIENSTWFGVLDYEDQIFVGKELNKVLVESQFATNIHDLIGYNMCEHEGCFLEDEWAVCGGKTKQEVINKLKNLIKNIQEV
jgi:hypothetical protein